MEFQAYPTLAASNRKDVRSFFKLQNVLHKTDSIVLPATLMVVACSLVAYQHITDHDTSRHSVRNFLCKILISMLPLAILEKRIVQCADPVRIFAKFSAKVMIMHACFLGLRMSSLVFEDVELAYRGFNIFSFVAACVLLPMVFGVHLTRESFYQHRDVWLLAFVSALLAFLEVSAFGKGRWSSRWQRSRLIEDVILTGSDYIEILSFVPAVWMAYRKDTVADATELQLADVAVTQKRALGLFAFMVMFYSVEDVAHAIDVRKEFPSAALGHAAHYFLLLDFAGYLLAHLCDPDKLRSMKGSFMSWVSDVCAV